ncbi:MAG: cytochrome c biogenesis protein ResB [Propionibacteriaceae bacterium]|nr:cytochrome c biogenesis protein ResB [Propionibacteriaceae bacterium]
MSPLEFFRSIYRFFYSKTVGLVVILAFTVLALIGALLTQAPQGTYADPAAKAQFLEQVSEKYGGWATPLNALGLFHVFSSIGFLVLSGFLAASVLACTAHRLPQLWERFRHPKTHATARFYAQARYRAEVPTSDTPDETLAVVEEHLRHCGYRVLTWTPPVPPTPPKGVRLQDSAIEAGNLTPLGGGGGDDEDAGADADGRDGGRPTPPKGVRLQDSAIETRNLTPLGGRGGHAGGDGDGGDRGRDAAAGRQVYADKFAWGGFGTAVAHASFLVILAAFVISSLTGVNEVKSLPVGGDPVAVGHGTDLSVQATSFQATYTDDGRPLDYVSRLVVTRAGATAGEQDVRVNEPLRVAGYKFHQASYGLAADVAASGPDGTLFDGMVPLQWTTTDGTAVVGAFDLAGPGLTVEVILPASGSADSGLAPGQAAFRIYRTGSEESLAMQAVDPGQPFTVGDYTFTFLRERQTTGILIRHDPGAPWMWVGSILLVVGMCVTFGFRHRRYWIRVEGDAVQIASSDKEDGAFRRRFDELATDVERLLAPTTDQPNEGGPR